MAHRNNLQSSHLSKISLALCVVAVGFLPAFPTFATWSCCLARMTLFLYEVVYQVDIGSYVYVGDR
jgi:hypothetical protein